MSAEPNEFHDDIEREQTKYLAGFYLDDPAIIRGPKAWFLEHFRVEQGGREAGAGF